MTFDTHSAVAHNETLTNGTQKTLLVGANDINGGTPHRHLTIDGNGRLLTLPYEHPSSWTNVRLATIAENTTPTYEATSVDCSSVAGVGTTSASIDMNGKRHLALVIEQTATASAGGLSNLRLQYSLDNTNWFRASQMITLEEQTSTKYVLAHRIENVAFRYVRLEVIAVMASPSATTLSISRSL